MQRREIIRLGFITLGLYGACCAMALGQMDPGLSRSARPDADGGRRPRPVAERTVGDEPASAAGLMQKQGGSLLRATLASEPDPARVKLRDVSFFAVPKPEPRTVKKHDLVTIIIREQSEFNSQGTTDLKKDANLDAKINQFIQLNLKNLHLRGDAIGASPPEISANLHGDYKGEATVSRSDDFTARIQAEVLDVKPNGTLVLQAQKRLQTDDEVQQFTLTGTCRAEDISVDNTVLSTQLADLQIHNSHEGDVRKTTRKGWLPKLLDALNPF